MANTNEILERIISKEKNAQTWYENAQAEHRRIINSDIKDKKHLSATCMNDMEKIAAYISELKEIGYLVMLNGKIDVHVFDEPTREKFDEACEKQKGPKPFKYNYLEFFQFGESLDQANLYIPPISSICKRKYDKYEPPSGDDGD